MTIPTNYAGINVAVRIRPSVAGGAYVPYYCQEVRIHVHGDPGDVTSGEDLAKRRIGTVDDYEITLTKASFDPSNDPFATPINLFLFEYLDILVYPDGIADPDPWVLAGTLMDDIDHSFNANALQPLTLHGLCGAGNSPLGVELQPD